jgi:hypothetical protein
MATQTTRATARFEPKPGDIVVLSGRKYHVRSHPSAPHIAYACEGKRANVYQLRDAAGDDYALKVFKKRYRDDSLLASAESLKRYETFEGMSAARRWVVPPTDKAALMCRELEYAMLMRWARGKTWFDILAEARASGTHLSLASGVHLCARFLNVIRALEADGAAHSDISPGNIMLDVGSVDVQVLDLEDMYAPGRAQPEQRNTGSAGYRHHTADEGATTWCPQGDRYAAAVVAAEMLVLAEPSLARKATDEGYFAGHCRNLDSAARYREADPWLRKVAPDFARLFEETWQSESLAGCHTVSELHAAVLGPALNTGRVEKAFVKPPVKWSRLSVTAKDAARRRGPAKKEKPSLVKWERAGVPLRRKKEPGLHPLTKATIVTAALVTLWMLLKLLALL